MKCTLKSKRIRVNRCADQRPAWAELRSASNGLKRGQAALNCGRDGLEARNNQYIDKLLEIKGIGMITVCGFIAEVGDIRRFDNPKQRKRQTWCAFIYHDS